MSVAGAKPGTEEAEEDLDMSTMALSYSRAQGSWFDNRNVFQTAVLIGETADTAFATRFRQTIANPQAPEPPHLLRLDYFTDEALTGLTQSPVAWPCPSQARFLVEAALKYLARCHYLVQREVVTGVQGTEMAMNPGRGTPELRAKFWVLFALGELCSARSLPSDGYPGVHYYAQATKLLGQLKERPGLDFIETLLMLSLYSLALNRRHSAYMYVGTAMRSAVIMGLHLSVPQHQLPDLFAREHRKRLFWTTYAYDRRWAALLNLPPAIHDAVIEVEYPSDSDVEVLGSVEADLGTCCSRSSTNSHDTEHKVASIQLSRLLSGVVDSVYGLKNRHKDTQLPTRVQRALDDLQEWNEHLPPSLQISKAGQGQDSMEAVSLRLSFYQCVILATRPMLLYSLRLQADQAIQSSRTVEPDATDVAVSVTDLPATAVALSAACVRCARHSAYLLTQSWMEGSFATFDCFFTHYLFSSATILAVSSLLGGEDSASDHDTFEQAAWLLKKL
ncbi:hypothetical protein N8I77_011558 [Diaporthe amygdali]|uniref:Xylanolytic transcriptional activator regulatory domain-containing protein n=1 Tax=Phomopsis amygdali TaxID=1214568 RepID=A0AAD9S702_PHOAM|nr:hypothetical protein N8I77_011558 [Diaporthe amygdali]